MDVFAAIEKLEREAESHGCQRCWSDDLQRPCTCSTERNLIKGTLSRLRAELASGSSSSTLEPDRG